MSEPGFGAAPPPPPSPPAPPAAEERPGNPWERRSELGFGGGLLAAIQLFVTNPSGAFEQTHRRGDFWSPLLFGVLVGWFGSILGQVWQLVFQGSMLSFFPADMRDELAAYFVTTPLMLAVGMVLTPIFLTIGLFLWSCVHHVSLLLVGALNESDAGFEGTFRVNSYGYVVQLAAVVPILGWLISIVWFIVMQTIGATRIHRTTTGKAFVGAVLPLLVCCACAGLMFFLFWAMIAGVIANQG